MGWANQGSKHVSSGLHSLCFSPWLDFWWGTAPERWKKKPSIPSWFPPRCLSQNWKQTKTVVYHVLPYHLSTCLLLSIIYFPFISLSPLSSISLSSLPTYLLIITYLSPFHLSWLSQSPITGCYQPLSIFCQYGSPAYRLWSRTCHFPSSSCASSFSLPVILSQPFAMKMRSLWTVHLVTSCFPSTVLPNGPPTPSLHCLCRVRGHLFSQLSPGCWGFPHRFPRFMKDTAMGLPVSHL